MTKWDPYFNWYNITTFTICFLVPLLILILCKKESYEKLIAYIPPFCTSTGIFFTFFILFRTLGVDFGKIDLNGADSLRDTIQHLSLKFSCSLIGIFFSIIWSIVIKVRDGARESLKKIQGEWMQKDPQELLWEISKSQNSVNDSLKQGFERSHSQQDSLHKVLMDKINSIGDFLQINLKESFSDFNQLLKEHINQLGSEALEDSKNNLELIQREFSGQTLDFLKSYQESLNGSLRNIEITIGNLLPVMEALVKKMGDQSLDLQTNASKNIQTIEEGFKESTNKMVGQFEVSASELRETFAMINSTFNTMDEQVQASSQEILQNHLKQIEKTFNSLEEMQGRAKTILDDATGQFASAVEEYKKVQSNNSEVLEQIVKQIEILENFQENARQHLDNWSEQAKDFEEMRNRIADIGNVVDQLQDLNTRLNQVIAINNHN